MPRHVEIVGKPRHMFGCRPSPKDPRDYLFTAKGLARWTQAALRTAYDPRVVAPRVLPRVEDQATIGSCVGHGWSSAEEMDQKTKAMLAGRDPASVPELSRLSVYYHGRVDIEGGDPADDSGMFVRSGGKACAKFGVPEERLWPYDVTKFSQRPPAAADRAGLKRQIVSYHLLPGINDALYALQEGHPVVGGFAVPASISSRETERTGVVKLPGADGTIGGHCVLFVGFDRRRKVLIFQNSWSTSWGDKGYGYLPFTFWKEGLLTDCWTLLSSEDGR